MLLPSGPDGDFNIPAQSSEEFQKASNREVARAVPHQQRDLRLLDAEDFGDLDLCHAAVLQDAINLQSELRLEQFLLGIGEAEIGKDVSAAFGHAGNAAARFWFFRFHFSYAFPSSRVHAAKSECPGSILAARGKERKS